MHGLIGRIRTTPGQRDALIEILIAGTASMPGNLSYIVARDSSDADAVWVTEVWESRASHQTSLSVPAVQQAIAEGKPLIQGFEERFETEPVGGRGLSAG
jgi:quinol monooxygenase YgiN